MSSAAGTSAAGNDEEVALLKAEIAQIKPRLDALEVEVQGLKGSAPASKKASKKA